MAIQTELTDLFEYGIDLKNRRIYFGHMAADSDAMTDFTQISVEFAIRALHRMVVESPNKPIELHVNSCGGNPYDALRLCDEILNCSAQIKFFGGGSIMSSATFVMAICDERYLHPNATVMVHDGSDGFDGNHTDHQIHAAEMKRLQNKLYKIYAENSRMPVEFWADVCQRDLYLTASEAVSLGLADRILEPKKRGNLRKARQAAMKKEIDTKEIKDLVKSLYDRTNRTRVPKIEFNEIKKEPSDPSLIIDETKMPEITPALQEQIVKKD